MEIQAEMEEKIDVNDFIARPYQTEILQIAIKENTIIFLPTGSGKTYIAIMLLNRLSQSIIKPNNKITVLLVNTIPLVEQHCNTIKRHTDFDVGFFTGDQNVDFWTKDQWLTELKKYQVVVFTAQIFLDIIRHEYFKLENVNLLIFDECHQAVNDQPMRQIMQLFQNVPKSNLPRVLGLTATLLNGNVVPNKVEDEVKTLETTFHSKVATIRTLGQVVGYSTNPNERIIYYHPATEYEETTKCFSLLENLITFIVNIKFNKKISTPEKKNLLQPQEKESKVLKKILTSLMIHIATLGIYGGAKSTLAYIIQIEGMKKHAEDSFLAKIYTVVTTTLTAVLKLLTDTMEGFQPADQIYKFSSPQVLSLIQIIRDNKERNLCGIIFAKQRFTTKALFYVLNDLSKHDPDFSFVQSDFMVGFNAGSSERDTRETYFAAKVNKKIVNSFRNKEINVLIASNVVEEGIDIPTCTLVVKFDRPMDYRSYIQSKGRARHNDSSYIIMVPENEKHKYMKSYATFQEVENILQTYLIGKTDLRVAPSEDKIKNELYDDHDVPPYYVSGPGSAHVTAVAAISLLNRYCQSLYRDRYVQLAPNWFLSSVTVNDIKKYVVEIEMPVSCPLRASIKGPPMATKLAAKRAAALEVCKQLHQSGELTNRLMPRVCDKDFEETFEHLFKCWAEEAGGDEVDGEDGKAKPKAGTQKYIRQHHIITPCFLSRKYVTNFGEYYLYPILMTSTLSNHCMSVVHNEILASNLGYGLISQCRLPNIAEFPIFLSAGEINIRIIRDKSFPIDSETMAQIDKFNYFLFNDLLKILQSFLAVNHDCDTISVVPINKIDGDYSINMDIVKNNTSLVPIEEPTLPEKLNLEVNLESYVGKIVCPWYRANNSIYYVRDVCADLNANSPFPSADFGSYSDYYREKYSQQIHSPQLPLLLVKGISQRMNCVLPRAVTLGTKRNKEAMMEGFDEHLVPELCVLQKYPGELWYLAYCLPTILHRVVCLLRAEELRRIIYNSTGFGNDFDDISEPLRLDSRIINSEQKKIEPVPERRVCEADALALPPPEIKTSDQKRLTNKDYASKMLERQYLWKDEQEPVDIDRNIDSITLVEIQYYEHFISEKYVYEDVQQTLEKAKSSKFRAVTFPYKYKITPITILKPIFPNINPDQFLIFQCLTSTKANEIVNLERLETLGDSMLKFAATLYLFLHYPRHDEGRLTHIKGKVISNRNLLYCALQKNIGEYMNVSDFAPLTDWVPPKFCVPEKVRAIVDSNPLLVSNLFSFGLTPEEQISNDLSEETVNLFAETAFDVVKDAPVVTDAVSSMNKFLNYQYIQDKTVSDCVEALIGAYTQRYGIYGGISLISWFNILPIRKVDLCINKMLCRKPESPLLHPSITQQEIDFHIPNYAKLEEHLGYTFNDRAYLLQALTHASYAINRQTSSYQRLEFLGDAILDFLITCHIFEQSENLTPGELTDLRSALVNNVTFACLVVRNGFHKHLKFINTKLMDALDTFVKYQEERDHEISEEVLILVEEHPMYVVEHVDVPKVLGDVFESLAGAVYLDSNKNLQKTWEVFHALMWKEIEMFSRKVPKNPVRMLYEAENVNPKFTTAKIENSVTVMSCAVTVNGQKCTVHGFGENKAQAKRAAAKLALKLINCK